jgi:hypothetical protein
MKRFLVSAVLATISTAPAFAQSRRVTFGIEAGTPLNNAFQGTASTAATLTQRNGNKALAGVSIKAPLPGEFVLSGGVMFRPLSFHRTTTNTSSPDIAVVNTSGSVTPVTFFQSDWWNSRGHAWEFPITIERTLFSRGRARPFASGGLAWRRTKSTTDAQFHFSMDSSTGSVGSSATVQAVFPSEAIKDSRTGLVVGAGIEIGRLPIRLSPQVRWTSWLNDGKPNGPATVGYARHSVDLLVGFTFP